MAALLGDVSVLAASAMCPAGFNCTSIQPQQDPYFHPVLGSLVKLVFLSSAIHQTAICLFSSLPFAVGATSVGRLLLGRRPAAILGLLIILNPQLRLSTCIGSCMCLLLHCSATSSAHHHTLPPSPPYHSTHLL